MAICGPLAADEALPRAQVHMTHPPAYHISQSLGGVAKMFSSLANMEV